MKRPAFQFYPADWRKDVELQSCSMAAQGLWVNALCIAHECDPYGHLTINSKAMTPAQLGRQVGLSAKDAEALVLELEDAGVLNRLEDGTIYSRRMVRDERLRNVRASAGRLGGNPNLVKQKDNHEVNQDPNLGVKQSLTPSSSSSSSSSEPKGSKASGKPEPLLTTDDLIDEGVDETVAADWMRVRKTKKALLTKTAWDGIKREASLAGLTPAQAVKHAAENNWQGFKASWLDGDRGKSAGGANDWTVSAS